MEVMEVISMIQAILGIVMCLFSFGSLLIALLSYIDRKKK